MSSPSMEREVGYNVCLPSGYEDNELYYPVIYFLHGAGGNENSDGPGFSKYITLLSESGEMPPAICVFPNGGYSGYRDHPENKVMVETMIIEELIPLIDARFRTRTHRESRMIAGFSMGCAGGTRLALKYPRLFSKAAGWGAAFTERRSSELPDPFLQPEALCKSKENYIVQLYMIVGYEDEYVDGFQQATQLLNEAQYPYTFRTLHGVHHNLGLYYESSGEDLARFLLEGLDRPTKERN